MPSLPIGRFHSPQSLAQLTKGRGFNSELVGFLLPFARKDFIYKEYDFLETAITDDPNTDWTLDNGGGTSAANFAKTANSEDGRITGDTGTDDDLGVAIVYDSIMFDAVSRPGMHVIMQVDDATQLGMEIGYFDALTDESLMAFTDLDTATLGNGGTDAVAIACDTDSATEKGFVLATGGTTDGDALVALGDSTACDPIASATDFDAMVQVFLNGGYGIIDNNLQHSGGLSTGPDTAKLMRPRVMCLTRESGTARFPTIDLIRIWCDRRGA